MGFRDLLRGSRVIDTSLSFSHDEHRIDASIKNSVNFTAHLSYPLQKKDSIELHGNLRLSISYPDSLLGSNIFHVEREVSYIMESPPWQSGINTFWDSNWTHVVALLAVSAVMLIFWFRNAAPPVSIKLRDKLVPIPMQKNSEIPDEDIPPIHSTILPEKDWEALRVVPHEGVLSRLFLIPRMKMKMDFIKPEHQKYKDFFSGEDEFELSAICDRQDSTKKDPIKRWKGETQKPMTLLIHLEKNNKPFSKMKIEFPCSEPQAVEEIVDE